MTMLSRLPAVALLACTCLPVAAAHYVSGTILPSQPAEERAAQLVDFYRQWKSVYFKHGCGEGQAYVDVGGDGKPVFGGTEAGTVTVSEAHGYGMLALVMMADVDADARADFDAMVAYAQAHPASSSPDLMAWNQVEGCIDAGVDVGGSNAATDGDLDIAYALLLADKVWGSDGAIDYAAKAEATMAAILAYEVDPVSMHLGIGDWAVHPDETYYRYTTRTSDFMLSHLRSFATASGEAAWTDVLERTYGLMAEVQQRFAPQTGLVPDFIIDLDGAPRPAPAEFLEGEGDGAYSWNAARYPWRVALDYLLFGDARAQASVAPLTAFMRHSTGDDPTQIADGYALDGTTMPDPGLNSMAFVAPLGVAAMVDPANQRWLDSIWADTVQTPISQEDYFGNTLKLLSMIAMNGRWEVP